MPTPQVQEPAPVAASTASAAPAAATVAPAEPTPAAEPAPTRSLGDRLFARTIAYMLNYSASPAKDKVTQACNAKSGDDPAAQAACVEKERAKLVSDVFVFEKSDKGTTWTTYRRTGNQLAEVNSVEIQVGADSPEKIELKIKSEKGPRQLFAGKKQVVILSDSDSSIAIDDPVFGKLIYEARIGLMESK
jgi:hypothetical protein